VSVARLGDDVRVELAPGGPDPSTGEAA
jgi:hypothetical protein